MSWKELQRSVTPIVVANALIFAIGTGAAHAGTIEKLDTSLNVQLMRTDLLGTPVRIAVGAHVYVMTYRGWIYSLDSSTFAYQIPPGAPSGENGVKMGGTDTSGNSAVNPAVALALGPSGDVYAGRDNGRIWHYNSSLAIQNPAQSQPVVTGTLVGLTVDSAGMVYAANSTGTISKLNADLTSTGVTRTLSLPSGSTVVSIKAQTAPNGAVAIFVALSTGTVYQLDNTSTLSTQANGSVSGRPANIAADTLGNVVVETSSGLYLTDYGINLQNVKSMTGLIGVDMDNSSNVVAASASNLYAMKVITTPTKSLSSGTSVSFSTNFSPIPSTFTAKETIAINGGAVYAIGGSYANTEGDPHLTTIDGTRYDFQGAGEFVLLRHAGNLKGEASTANVGVSYPPHDAAEIQIRQFPVATTANTCVSLNSAIATQVGKHRVTYEPNLSGQPDPSGLQLRIDGKLLSLDPSGISLGNGGRVVPTAVPGGLEIDFPNDDALFVTPGWWDSQGKWYLNVNVIPQQRGGGLVGDVPEGSWLPALPDGTSMGPAPASPHERYVALYERFANAWRVTDKTSLFDYAPGTSTGTFTMRGWPPETGACSIPGTAPVKGIPEEVAREVCKVVPGDPANCIFDVKVTGLINIANTYVASRSVQPVPEPTRPKPCCVRRGFIALLVLLGVIVLLALWIILSRRRSG